MLDWVTLHITSEILACSGEYLSTDLLVNLVCGGLAVKRGSVIFPGPLLLPWEGMPSHLGKAQEFWNQMTFFFSPHTCHLSSAGYLTSLSVPHL